MSKCESIAILMAIYEPRIDWLREQLLSLDKQVYHNLKLYIIDDCSQTISFVEIKKCVENCIHSFPFEIKKNEKNLGINQTFELLTKEADGDYFAYCDQDDIWLPQKLIILHNFLKHCQASLSYSDMSIINDNGQQIASSLREIRPRLRYAWGDKLAETYFFRNCTAGCSMILSASCAKSALPFPKKTMYDHWLTIIAAVKGKITFCPNQLLCYRQHANNQTGILVGVTDKQSYRQIRLEPLKERLLYLQKYMTPSAATIEFIEARFNGKITQIWKHRSLSPFEANFEIAMKFMPEFIFKRVIRSIQ